jgi:serine/threonine-protein kinase HipA
VKQNRSEPGTEEVQVHLHEADASEPLLLGTLSARQVRARELFSFTASSEWIAQGRFRWLDPDLGQFAGPQYLRDEKPNFGLFLDSAPDRWGRLLLSRREALLAREEGRTARRLQELDFLLGVFDGTRMGALRFRLATGRNFLDDNAELAAPPMASLRQLEQASLQLEREDAETLPGYGRWLKLLLAPGSSLGGARPKASVTDGQGNLWLAKFPSRNDERDMGAWEGIVAGLAQQAGVQMAEFAVSRYGSRGHTFLTRRFDRAGAGRIHFASAMTLLGHTDGTSASDGASYLELAEFLMRHGAQSEADLVELWRRIAFHIAVSNCDDHLRNHGFLLTRKGWVLSPAYDLNPDPLANGLRLNISEQENTLDFGLALEVAPYFRLTPARARKILAEIGAAVVGWRELAKRYEIPRSEQERMAGAFRVP